jgi:hypothetical protein
VLRGLSSFAPAKALYFSAIARGLTREGGLVEQPDKLLNWRETEAFLVLD